jgi:hypothetical protein
MAVAAPSPSGGGSSRPATPTRWRKASVVGAWYKAWRGHMRRDAQTLDLAAKLLERELRKTKGLDRAVAFVKAKRTVFWLHRAAAHADACSDNLDRFYRRFQENFTHRPEPRAAKAEFDPDH